MHNVMKIFSIRRTYNNTKIILSVAQRNSRQQNNEEDLSVKISRTMFFWSKGGHDGNESSEQRQDEK